MDTVLFHWVFFAVLFTFSSLAIIVLIIYHIYHHCRNNKGKDNLRRSINSSLLYKLTSVLTIAMMVFSLVNQLMDVLSPLLFNCNDITIAFACIFYNATKISMYSIFVIRLYYIYKKSIYSYNVWVIISWIIFIIISHCGMLIYFYLTIEKHFYVTFSNSVQGYKLYYIQYILKILAYL